PVLTATAGIYQKVFDDLFAFGGMVYFGVKLYAIERLTVIFLLAEGSHGNAIGGSQYFKPLGQLFDAVAMAHPHLAFGSHIREELVIELALQRGSTIFAFITFCHQASKTFGGKLRAVAHTQHRYVLNHRLDIHVRGAIFIYRK